MSTSLIPKTKIGNYILIERFPLHGRSGETWIATHKDTQQKVVIKIPAFDSSSKDRDSQRIDIRSEINILQYISKVGLDLMPPVVEYLDTGFHKHPFGERYPYLVTELVGDSWQTLSSILASFSSISHFPKQEILEIYYHVVILIRDVHSLGIVYNDVKLEHIFWDRTARPSYRTSKASKRLRIIDWANSFFSQEPQDQQKDIHQLGELLYEIITLQRAFENQSREYFPKLHKLALEILNHSISDISQILSVLDSELRTFETDMEQILNNAYISFAHLIKNYNSCRDTKEISLKLSVLVGESSLKVQTTNPNFKKHLLQLDNYYIQFISRTISLIVASLQTSKPSETNFKICLQEVDEILRKISGYSENEKAFLQKLIDFMAVSYELLVIIEQDQVKEADEKILLSSITYLWDTILNCLPTLKVVQISEVCEILFKHFPSSAYENFYLWRYFAQVSLQYSEIYRINDQLPIDIHIVKLLLDGIAVNKNILPTKHKVASIIYNFHDEIFSAYSERIPANILTGYRKLLQTLPLEDSKVLETIVIELEKAAALSVSVDVSSYDYRHKMLINWYQSYFDDIRSDVTNFTSAPDLRSGNDFLSWIQNYLLLHNQLMQKGIGLKIALDVKDVEAIESTFMSLLNYMSCGELNQVQRSLHKLTDMVSRLSVSVSKWLLDAVDLGVDRNYHQHDLRKLWNSPLEVKNMWSEIRTIYSDILEFNVSSDLSKLEEYNNNLGNYISHNSCLEATLNSSQLIELFNCSSFILECTKENIFNSYEVIKTKLDLFPPDSVYVNSIITYLNSIKVEAELSNLASFSEIKNFINRFDKINLPKHDEKSIKKMLQYLLQVKSRWEAGDFNNNLSAASSLKTYIDLPLVISAIRFEDYFTKVVGEAEVALRKILNHFNTDINQDMKRQVLLDTLETLKYSQKLLSERYRELFPYDEIPPIFFEWEISRERAFNEMLSGNSTNVDENINDPFSSILRELIRQTRTKRFISQLSPLPNLRTISSLAIVLAITVISIIVVPHALRTLSLNQNIEVENNNFTQTALSFTQASELNEHNASTRTAFFHGTEIAITATAFAQEEIIISITRTAVATATERANILHSTDVYLTALAQENARYEQATQTAVATFNATLVNNDGVIRAILIRNNPVVTIYDAPNPNSVRRNALGEVQFIDTSNSTYFTNGFEVIGFYEFENNIYYLTEVVSPAAWVDSDDVTLSHNIDLLPLIQITSTPTPIQIIDFSGETDISNELGRMLIPPTGSGTHPFNNIFNTGPISNAVYLYYFNNATIIPAESYREGRQYDDWTINANDNSSDSSIISTMYPTIPLHIGTLGERLFGESLLQSFRITASLNTRSSMDIYGVNFISRLEDGNVSVVWLIARVEENSSRGFYQIWQVNSYNDFVNIENEGIALRERIEATNIQDPNYVIANIPVDYFFTVESETFGTLLYTSDVLSDLTDIDLGIVRQTGDNISITIDKVPVYMLNTLPFSSIEQFGIVSSPITNATISGIFISTE